MNVLILTADYPPIEGGICTVALNTSRELVAAGHTVTVIAPHFPDTADFDRHEALRVERYRGYHLGRLRFFPMLAKSLRHLWRADLLLGINVAYGGVIAWLSRRPYVTFAYAYEFLKFKDNATIRALLRRVYSKSRVVIAISSFTREKLIEFGVSSSRVATIFPGAPKSRRCSADEIETVREKFDIRTKHMILSVARFVKRKGHDTLIKALPEVLKEYPDTVMVLVGRGPREEATRALAEDLGVGDHIRMTGRLPRSEIDALYQICELFALPTGEDEHGQVEGFGLVFSEAHAYGKPVVAGRSGGVVDAVHDGKTGFLVDVAEPDQLVEAILKLMHDPNLAARLGLNGKARVEEELNWTHFVARMLEEVEARA